MPAKSFVLATVLLAPWLSASADVIVLAPVADTSIFSVSPNNNLGASATLAVGGNANAQPGRGLIRFDLTGKVPAGAMLTRASFGFRVVRNPASAVESTFAIHRVLVPWSEGAGTGNTGRPAVDGESTWLHRVQPDVAWSEPGGGAGVDYADPPSAMVPMLREGTYVMESAGLVDDVRLWLADPSQNFGWMLKGNTETDALTARRVGAREDPPNAAALTVEYVVPMRPVIVRSGRNGQRFELEFQAEAGNIYEVQATGDPAKAVSWQMVTNYVVKLISTNIVYSELIQPVSNRLFRIADVGDVD